MTNTASTLIYLEGVSSGIHRKVLNWASAHRNLDAPQWNIWEVPALPCPPFLLVFIESSRISPARHGYRHSAGCSSALWTGGAATKASPCVNCSVSPFLPLHFTGLIIFILPLIIKSWHKTDVDPD